MRSLPSLIAVVASGVLYSLSFPPARLYWLAWVALVPFLVAVRRARPGAALVLTWAFTIASAYASGDWFPRAVAGYYDQPAIVGIGFFFGVSTIMASPFVIAFAFCYRAAARRAGAATPLLAAAAWVASEIGRARLLTGNPWVLFGYSQFGVDAIVQVADLTGVYGVSFALVAVNAAAAELWLAIRTEGGLTRAAAGGLGAALAVVALVTSYATLHRVEPVAPDSLVPIAVVQGNLDLGAQWRRELYGRNLDLYLRLTVDAVRNGSPRLVFWPETAMTFFLDDEPLYRDAIRRVTEFKQTELVAGGPRVVEADDTRYFNTAFLLAPDGTVHGRYDKQHLLPFAEYFPFPRLDFLRRNFGRVREFTPGAATPPLSTVAGRAGVMICNEAMYPEIAAERVRDGAEYLIVLSNDSWLNDLKYSEIAFNMVAFRAIEQRRYLVRASTSGPSAIVDPAGRVLVRTDPLTRATIAGSIAPRTEPSFYARHGDVFAGLCTALAAVAWWWLTAATTRPSAWTGDRPVRWPPCRGRSDVGCYSA